MRHLFVVTSFSYVCCLNTRRRSAREAQSSLAQVLAQLSIYDQRLHDIEVFSQRWPALAANHVDRRHSRMPQKDRVLVVSNTPRVLLTSFVRACSSYGYSLRVSDEFKIFTNVNSAVINPKAFDERSFISGTGGIGYRFRPIRLPWHALVEYFRIPRDVLTICVGK